MIGEALLCLALNVYHESRGEPVKGQQAVALVTMNRAKGEAKRVCKEVYKPKQFSWVGKVAPAKKSSAAWERAMSIAKQALAGQLSDFTGGATHFHSLSVKPNWKGFKHVMTVGNHRFYRSGIIQSVVTREDKDMKPYGSISDSHHHNWNAFSITLANGVNSRLQMKLDETRRAANTVKSMGGKFLYHGGDLFHVRGSIAPSVLNPTVDCYKEINDSGVQIVINAGNHDLEGKEANRVSSAITALERVGCLVIDKPTLHDRGDGSMFIIPWMQSISDLKIQLELLTVSERAGIEVLMHAPIDGVIKGLPDHGLTWEYLDSLGYKRIMSGHYHNHKHLGGEVYSIGALTHDTWGDIGSKAGFITVDDRGVKYHATHAPSFIEINGATDPDEIPLLVDGNYVRVTINSAKASDVETMRQFLLDSGAVGVNVLQDVKAAPVSRTTGPTIKAGATLEASIGDFIVSAGYVNQAAVQAACTDILTKVRSVA